MLGVGVIWPAKVSGNENPKKEHIKILRVMDEFQTEVVAKAKKIVTDIFNSQVNPLFIFHNITHTEQVVKAAEEIECYYQLNDRDQFVLFISAWFHDTGFSAGRVEGHEKESIKLASAFLYHYYADPEIMRRVSSCIRATEMPQSPANQIEKIMCDADLYHLGTSTFNRWNAYLRQEIKNYCNRHITNEEWCQANIQFLMSHNFFTGYCRQKLEPVKQEWIKQLQSKQRRCNDPYLINMLPGEGVIQEKRLPQKREKKS